VTIRSRLAAVLRARRAQEDIARGALARANAQLDQARAVVSGRGESLTEWTGPRGGDSNAFLASVAAGRALAESLGRAEAARDQAHSGAEDSRDVLRGAAQRRRSVEKLVERAQDQYRRDNLAAEQRSADDLTTGRAAGSGGSGPGGSGSGGSGSLGSLR
jgi:flagellar protein FliJ